MLLKHSLECDIECFSSASINVVEESFLNSLDHCFGVVIVIGFTQDFLCASRNTPIDLVTDMYAQCPTCMPVKCEDKYFLTRFPEIDSFVNRSADLWMS